MLRLWRGGISQALFRLSLPPSPRLRRTLVSLSRYSRSPSYPSHPIQASSFHHEHGAFYTIDEQELAYKAMIPAEV